MASCVLVSTNGVSKRQPKLVTICSSELIAALIPGLILSPHFCVLMSPKGKTSGQDCSSILVVAIGALSNDILLVVLKSLHYMPQLSSLSRHADNLYICCLARSHI